MKRCPKCGKSYPDEANFCPTDAGRLVTVATDAIAAQAPAGADVGLLGGRFQLGPMIGGTATGAVHRATDTAPTGNGAAHGPGAAAVKLIDPAVIAMPQVAQRIERELKQLERVQHPGVARVLGSGVHGDSFYVATELIEGARPLGELVAASGPLDPQRASELIVAIGEALIEAAKVGVVHRDLSPKNVLITQDSLRLINFAVPTPGEKVAGIVEFAAPEVIEGKPVDQRSNIYSLGALYYFLLTGRPPHVGDPGAVLQGHLSGTVEPPSRHAPVPGDIDGLVVRALERNAAKRYLTLRQFLDEVERVVAGPEGGVGSTQPFGSAGKPKELSTTLTGLGLGGSQAAAAHPQGQKTRQVDVAIPPEAVGPAPVGPAALHAAAGPGATVHGVPVAPIPVGGPAQAQAQPQPQAGESPWVRPGQEPAPAPVPPPQHVAPAPAHPPAPAGRPSAGGKKKKDDDGKASKGKFRETMWFKKGELDAAAAEEAAATGDATAAGKADLLPIEERYHDDGTITRSDAERYSLKTGATSMMPAMRGNTGAQASVSERELVSEMKGGRNLVILGIVIGIALLIGIVAMFAL